MDTQQRKKWHSIPLRRSAPIVTATSTRATNSYVQSRKSVYTTAIPDIEDQDYRPVQIPRSARRYVDTQGREVFQQSNKRIVVEHVRKSWLLPAGLGMMTMVALMAGLIWAVNTWDAHKLDATYGFPRIWQTDVNVGHGKGDSHFLFENLSAHVFFEEIPGGDDFAHAR